MFKRHRDKGLFDEELRLSRLSKQSDPLEKLNKVIDWEMFRTVIEPVFKKEAKGKGGRRPYDYVLLFKMLVLQRYYNLSDDQIEYQVLDRLSFMRFLGLKLSDDVPDSKTVWNFREILSKNNTSEKLFELFTQKLKEIGLVANEGRIVDASFVEVPKQRNKKEDNDLIKEEAIPKEWKNNPHKLRQKDTDARWTQKNNVNYFGYKDHVKIDKKSKIILKYCVTDASAHDSQEIENLIEPSDKNQPLWADSAYSGAPIAQVLKRKRLKNQIHEKGTRNTPLTEAQKVQNTEKSKIRCRVEHVFGFIENSMNGSYIRCIGQKRAKEIIGLMNLTYNICRYSQLTSFQRIAMS